MTIDNESHKRILVAARTCFAKTGFLGTSTRVIAGEADVAQSLILYHFKTKDALWRAVMEDSFGRLAKNHMQTELLNMMSSPEDRMKAIIRGMVDFMYGEPEFHRLMILENAAASERLDWLIDNYIIVFYKRMIGMIEAGQAEGFIRPLNSTLIYYSIIALSGTPFSAAPEAERLGINPSILTPESVTQTIYALVFQNHSSR